MTFPELQKAGSDGCSSGKGRDAETREEQSRDNSAALGQVLVPPQGIITIALRSSTELNPNKGKMSMKHSSFQKKDLQSQSWDRLNTSSEKTV